jgi:hypothetical protein
LNLLGVSFLIFLIVLRIKISISISVLSSEMDQGDGVRESQDLSGRRRGQSSDHSSQSNAMKA